MREISKGKIITPANINNKKLHTIGIGKGLMVKINANIGASRIIASVAEELTAALVSNSFSVIQILGIFNLFNKYQLPKWIKDPKKREALKQLQIEFAQKPEFINNSQEYFFVAQNHKNSD